MTDKTPAIYAALAAVMADCDHVAKRDRNEQQRFVFRGIDAVLNAVGPVLRKHKVMVLPQVKGITYDAVTTSKGAPMTRVRVSVDYVFLAVDGSSVTATVAAESFDSGDKATAKAMSVAFRTALIQALALPTDEPDPDSFTYEIGAEPSRQQQRPQQQPSPLDAKRAEMRAVWEKTRGQWDFIGAATEYADHSGGELQHADITHLDQFIAHLKGANDAA